MEIEPTWDSSSESSTPELEKNSSNSSSHISLISEETNMKIVEGGKTFILTSENHESRLSKRRQSTHRREFHNVSLPPLPSFRKS
jgi:hypothetical protein